MSCNLIVGTDVIHDNADHLVVAAAPVSWTNHRFILSKSKISSYRLTRRPDSSETWFPDSTSFQKDPAVAGKAAERMLKKPQSIPFPCVSRRFSVPFTTLYIIFFRQTIRIGGSGKYFSARPEKSAPGTYGAAGCRQTARLRQIVQDKTASAADEGAYSLYVTEICKRSPLESKIATQFCGCATLSSVWARRARTARFY